MALHGGTRGSVGFGLRWRLSVPVLLQEQCVVDAALEYVPGAHQFGLSQNSHFLLPFNQSAVRKR